MEASSGEPSRRERVGESKYGVSDITDVFKKWCAPKSAQPESVKAASEALLEAFNQHRELYESAEVLLGVHQGRIFSSEAETDPDSFLHHQVGYRVGSSPRALPFPEYGANKFLRAALWHPWRQDPSIPGFPEKANDPVACCSAIRRIFQDQDKVEEFEFNLVWRPIGTTVPSRGAGPKLGIAARYPGSERLLNMVSIGHGTGAIEKKLLLNETFGKVRAVNWHNSEILEESPLNIAVQGELSRPLAFEQVTCMDLFPGDKDPALKEWNLSCLRPEEHRNAKFIRETKRLADLQPDRYTSLFGDFTEPQGLETIKSSLTRPADVVLFSTMFYQLSQEEQAMALKNALDILDDDGMIILQDHVSPIRFEHETDLPMLTDNSPQALASRLYFPSEWTHYTYTTNILYPALWGWEFKTIMRSETGRSRQIELTNHYQELRDRFIIDL